MGKGVLQKQLLDRAAMITDRGASEKAEGSLDTLLAKSRDIADGKTSGLTAGASGVVNGGLHVLADAAKWAGGEVAQLGGAVAGFLGQLDHTTIGGRNNNPLNTRPVGKSGFVHFTRPEDGLEAAGRQILRDRDRHGAKSIYDLYAGAVGPDGKRHWYAPASDHNDPESYAR